MSEQLGWGYNDYMDMTEPELENWYKLYFEIKKKQRSKEEADIDTAIAKGKRR